MRYYIKEWPDQTASLIAEDGHALDIFDSVFDAVDTCISDCLVEPDYIESHSNYLATSPLDFESAYLS